MGRIALSIRRRLNALGLSREARPPGELRRLSGVAAEQLEQATSFLRALDQAVEAITVLRRRRIARRNGRAAIDDLALLRFGIVQFADCLEAGCSAGPPPAEVYGATEGALAFYRSLQVFRDQLSGPQARLVGETEAVALVRRINGHPVLQGVATRTRRPDRLTSVELAQILSFMLQARAVWARHVDEQRRRLLEEARALTADQLESLPAVESR